MSLFQDNGEDAPANLAGRIGLQSLLAWLTELILFLDYREPEGSQSIVVVAASMAMALNHRLSAEVLQAGAGGNEVLANTSSVIQGGLKRV